MPKPGVPFRSAVARMAAELAVIVAGVLIALAAQSWWEARGERADSARALGLLRSDLISLRQFAVGDTRPDSALQAIDALWDSNSAVPDSVQDRLHYWALYAIAAGGGHLAADELLPAYTDLKGSGRLALLPESIRLMIPAIEFQMKRVNDSSDDLFAFQTAQLDPHVIETFTLTRRADGGSLVFDMAVPGNAEAVRTRRMRNMLVYKATLTRLVLSRRADLVEEIDRVLDGLNAVRR